MEVNFGAAFREILFRNGRAKRRVQSRNKRRNKRYGRGKGVDGKVELKIIGRSLWRKGFLSRERSFRP